MTDWGIPGPLPQDEGCGIPLPRRLEHEPDAGQVNDRKRMAKRAPDRRAMALMQERAGINGQTGPSGPDPPELMAEAAYSA